MQTRNLGETDLKIVPVVFGGNVFGWTVNEAKSFELLDAWVDGGFNCIDTADVYSVWVPGHVGGESETIIGKWLKQSGKRDQVVLLTKVGFEMKSGGKGLSKRYILEEVEASLKRLQTDHIDLYQSHTDDESVALEETLEAYAQLIDEGKVRYIGASNYKGARLAEAEDLAEREKLPAYKTLQPARSAGVRDGPGAGGGEIWAGRNSVFLVGVGILDGQVSEPGRREGKKARGSRAKVF
jgi:aryl-alcohol dehydrogenase-like predicted oxidoreductase